MQVGLLSGDPKHDLRGVIACINRVIPWVHAPPHLAASVIRHHHWVWSNLITRRSITVASTSELLG